VGICAVICAGILVALHGREHRTTTIDTERMYTTCADRWMMHTTILAAGTWRMFLMGGEDHQMMGTIRVVVTDAEGE